ncbi:MAG TPA: hypothetical protein VI455_11730 [Terriglobia bacterium]
MTRRQTAGVAVVLVAVTAASALVAYRRGLRRGLSQARPAASASEARPGDASGGCIDFRQAGTHTGEQACVSGRVLKVFTAGSGNTFLDFCADFRNCPFTSIVFASDRSKFGDLGALGGRLIEIRGKIVPYHGQPEIIVSDPSQIRGAP